MTRPGLLALALPRRRRWRTALVLGLALAASPSLSAGAADAGDAASAGSDAGPLRPDDASGEASAIGSRAPADGASDGGETSSDGPRHEAGGDAAPRLPGWAPKLTATVKPVVVAIGDPVTVTIKVRHKKEVSVTLPLRLELGKFTELERGESRREVGEKGHIPEVEQTFSLRVAAYELGEVTLPPIEVTALGSGGELLTLRTAAMPIRIRSLMANEPKPQLKGLAPPVSVWQRDWLLLYLLVGVGAAGLVVLVTLVVSRRLRARRAALRPPAPPTPPHVVALRRLRELDVEVYIADERYKELYLQLSEIVRAYVGGRWGFEALEMTTTEIRQALLDASVEATVRERLDATLVDWDLVKFAKVRPGGDGARAAAAAAETFVRETMVQPVASAGAVAVGEPHSPPPADRDAGGEPAGPGR